MRVAKPFFMTLASLTLVFQPCYGDVTFVESFANFVTAVLSEDGSAEIPFPQDGARRHGYREAAFVDNVQDGPTVVTTTGRLRGAIVEEAYAFYSVPYAKPPERFQPPEPITEPFDDFNATTPNGLVCHQRKKDCNNGVCIENISEDCLVLNVHVPLSVDFSSAEAAAQSARPVFVWFYGGGFFEGGGTVPEFEARWFSNATKAIMVTINYRLGPFGFLVHGDGDDAIKGNQGLKDQQLAMKWVQDNIADFGGDPNKVTIFGNSAGAQSVMFHLVSDVSNPLFQRAIMESNPAVFQYQTLDEAMNVTNRLLRVLGCSNLTVAEERQCLMDAPAENITRAVPVVMARSLLEDQDLWSTVEAFRPVLDGTEFREQPFAMFRDGNWQSGKDVIIGTNTQELEIMQFYVPDKVLRTEKAFRKVNEIAMGSEELGDQVSNMYLDMADKYLNMSGNGTIDYQVLLGIESSHMFFHCPSRLLARFASITGTGKVYLYSDAHAMEGPGCQAVVTANETCGYAFHGSEPPFVFRSGPGYGFEFSEDDIAVSNQFDSYWVNFGESGDPSNGGLTELGDFGTWYEYVIDDVMVESRDVIATYKNQMWDMRRRAKKQPHENHVFKNYHQRSQKATTVSGWSNIRIEAPESKLEDGYLEEICDFWDSLNFYVDLKPEGTPQPQTPTTKQPGVPQTSSPITTAIGEENPTTTGDASSIRSNYAILVSMVISAIYYLSC